MSVNFLTIFNCLGIVDGNESSIISVLWQMMLTWEKNSVFSKAHQKNEKKNNQKNECFQKKIH
jgi:hypothetical protein